MSSLWMACHNINARALQAGKQEVAEATAMRDKIGIGVRHANYEELIAEAEAVLAKYGSHGDAAIFTLSNVQAQR